MKESVRPASVKDEHFEYLNKLRDSGETNMFGAGTYLMRKFALDSGEAKEILMYWMETYD